MLQERARILDQSPLIFKPLISPHLAKLDAAVDPGLSMLNWTSLNLDTYIGGVYEALEEFELLIRRANDLVKYRIDAVLEEMSSLPLCSLPKEKPFTCDEFLKNTEVRHRDKKSRP